MTDPAPAPAPAIFNFNAYSPAEIQDAIERVGVKKANMPFLPSFMLAAVAGGSIGLGALYYTIVASDADLSFATVRVVGGLVTLAEERRFPASKSPGGTVTDKKIMTDGTKT